MFVHMSAISKYPFTCVCFMKLFLHVSALASHPFTCVPQENSIWHNWLSKETRSFHFRFVLHVSYFSDFWLWFLGDYLDVPFHFSRHISYFGKPICKFWHLFLICLLSLHITPSRVPLKIQTLLLFRAPSMFIFFLTIFISSFCFRGVFFPYFFAWHSI